MPPAGLATSTGPLAKLPCQTTQKGARVGVHRGRVGRSRGRKERTCPAKRAIRAQAAPLISELALLFVDRGRWLIFVAAVVNVEVLLLARLRLGLVLDGLTHQLRRKGCYAGKQATLGSCSLRARLRNLP